MYPPMTRIIIILPIRMYFFFWHNNYYYYYRYYTALLDEISGKYMYMYIYICIYLTIIFFALYTGNTIIYICICTKNENVSLRNVCEIFFFILFKLFYCSMLITERVLIIILFYSEHETLFTRGYLEKRFSRFARCIRV